MKKKQKIQILLGCVCLVLTFAICIQLKTIENANKVVGSSFTENELRDEVLRWKEKYDNMVRETERAEKSLEEYREKASQDNAFSASIEEELKLANNLLGLTDLRGRGVMITLQDKKATGLEALNVSDYLVHAQDLVEIVNELKNANAEAISINGQRIVSTTGIVCDGTVVRINGQKVGGPYVILAIGQPEWIETSLTMQGGFIQRIENYVDAKVEKVYDIQIPKYEGVYNIEYMTTVEE
mgnify:FL=1